MFKMVGDVLQIRKVDIEKPNINIMSDIQQSYRKYIEETIYSDMAYLESKLRQIKGYEDIELKVTVERREDQTYARTQVKSGTYFYPVYGDIKLRGELVGRHMELLRIPYMDDYGKIYVDGAQKVVLGLLRAAEDVSYSMKLGIFNIAMPKANIRVAWGNKGINVIYGKTKTRIEMLISAMLHDIGDDSTKVADIIRNTVLINRLSITDKTSNESCYDYVSTYGLLDKYKSIQYRLGDTRDALNEALSLDRAKGETLSRAVLSYPAGTVITESMLAEFKRNRINVIYVQEPTALTGYMLHLECPYVIHTIPSGTKNCALLRRHIPEYTSYQSIPVDVQLSEHIVLNDSMRLTNELAEFLLITGFDKIQVKTDPKKRPVWYSFEREVIGNYTARLRELTTSIPNGRSADEWVYYYNNDELLPNTAPNMTAHDFLAIFSVMGQIKLRGVSPLLNRDTSLLKRVLLINEIFSESLCNTIDSYVSSKKSSIANKLLDATGSNPFQSLTSNWISYMNANSYLSVIDSTNITAEISQATHINTANTAQSEIADEQRQIAMPFYGRICPFETPAGKKLGLVNTKALGARIENGMLLAPYRKVIGTPNGIRISKNITWMSVKDELGKKFGDMLSLKRDPHNPDLILNTPILARVPNPDASDEPFLFVTLNAHELAGGYVDAFPEQFCSPTVAFVPFAGSNDAIRISYGASQMRQAIYLPGAEKPLVFTDMYEDVFEYSSADKYYSPCNGTVSSVNNTQAVIVDNDGVEHVMFLQGYHHTGQLDAAFDLLVSAGDDVVSGQLIAEGHKYPQSFVTRAPFSGRIESIDDNCICIDKSGNSNNLLDYDIVRLQNSRIMGQSVLFTNIKVSVGDYVTKGQVLADTCISKDGTLCLGRQPLVGYISTAYNYEDGVQAYESAAVKYISMIAHKIDTKISKRNCKHSRIQVPQGFNYAGPGDTVTEIRRFEQYNDTNYTNMHVVAGLADHGICFEGQTLEDREDSKLYRHHLLGFNKLKGGDKMSGRDGNKGVVSRVFKDSEAPQLANGRPLEIILNPCGIPSRMNLGQVLDGTLGLIAYICGVRINSNAYNGATVDEVAYLMRFTHAICNTTSIGDNVTKQYNRAAFDTVCRAFPDIPQHFCDLAWENIETVIDWRGVFNEYGDARLYDPETGTWFENYITIGMPTYFKLMQEADEKLHVRSGPLQEKYTRTTTQPQKGDHSVKGQRMAEMELMALLSAGTADFIDEVINEKSDNDGRRVNNHLTQLGYDIQLPSYCCESRSVDNLLYYFEAMGVKCEVPPEVANIDSLVSKRKYTIDLPKFLIEQQIEANNKKASVTDMLTDYNSIED